MRTWFLFLACGFLLGCQAKNTDHNVDPRLEAYRLIDEQRTDEAIELLETELQNDENNNELKVALASAYAHKGGIKIQKLVPIVSSIDKINKDRSAPIDTQKQKNLTEKTHASLINASLLLSQFSRFVEVYVAIPVADRNQADYIRHAILLFNEIESKNLKQEDVLYRLILEIVLLKHILVENFIGEFVPPKSADKKKCRLDLAMINHSIVGMGKLLIDIFNDAGFIRPQTANDMKKLASQTSDAVNDLTIFFTSATVVDDITEAFLSESLIQHGFGKIIKCGGN